MDSRDSLKRPDLKTLPESYIFRFAGELLWTKTVATKTDDNRIMQQRPISGGLKLMRAILISDLKVCVLKKMLIQLFKVFIERISMWPIPF